MKTRKQKIRQERPEEMQETRQLKVEKREERKQLEVKKEKLKKVKPKKEKLKKEKVRKPQPKKTGNSRKAANSKFSILCHFNFPLFHGASGHALWTYLPNVN